MLKLCTVLNWISRLSVWFDLVWFIHHIESTFFSGNDQASMKRGTFLYIISSFHRPYQFMISKSPDLTLLEVHNINCWAAKKTNQLLYYCKFERFTKRSSNSVNFWAWKKFFFFKLFKIWPEIDGTIIRVLVRYLRALSGFNHWRGMCHIKAQCAWGGGYTKWGQWKLVGELKL